MDIMTERFGYEDITRVLRHEQELGRIADHVSFKQLSQYRPRNFEFGFHVQLQAEERDNGRRAGNSGSYGAMSPSVDGFAATYDEWGWLLSGLYALDDYMVVGSPKNPVYADRWDFEHRTGLTYLGEELLARLDSESDLEFMRRQFIGDGVEAHPFIITGDPYPFQMGRGGRGREGSGRITGDGQYPSQETCNAAIQKWAEGGKTGNDYVRFVPRSREEYEKFAHVKIDERLLAIA